MKKSSKKKINAKNKVAEKKKANANKKRMISKEKSKKRNAKQTKPPERKIKSTITKLKKQHNIEKLKKKHVLQKHPKKSKHKKTIKKTSVVITNTTKTPETIITPVKKELSKELEKILSDAKVRYWLIELGGENSLDIIKNLHIISNDEELAKKLEIRISDVRASLNKMHNEGLIIYARNKNSETGWYSYDWILNEKRIIEWVNKSYAKQYIYKPQEGIDFYFCKKCGIQSAITFEVASEQSFKCANCNSALDFLDNETFERLKKRKTSKKQL